MVNDMDTKNRQAQVRHLYSRVAFGATPAELSDTINQPLRKTIRQLFRDSASGDDLIVVEPEQNQSRQVLRGLVRDGQLDKEMLKQRIKLNAQKIRDLNLLWVDRMAAGKGGLREKMALFWHGHFACRPSGQNALFMQQYVNTIRRNALGKFGDLLMGVSKEPAMLQFLSNQQNRKNAPNENFAREVMELFTLGHSASGRNYSEHDIKEAARAFTGWQYTPDGAFVFRERVHDTGDKTIFGKTGPFVGEDVIALLLANRQTARFVTGKLYRFFVTDSPTDEAEAKKRIDTLADQFYDSGYNIADLMETIVNADWFYEARNVGTHIKSPVELLAGMRHTLGVTFDQPQPQIFVQRTLGQTLFYPPNVAGWPGGRNWIDSSSLLFRMQLPAYVLKAADVTIRPKEDGDVNTETLARKGGTNFRTTVDWAALEQAFANVDEPQLVDAIAGTLLPFALRSDQRTLIDNQVKDVASRSERIRSLTASIMSLPEYQLS
jgi:uncharacterized protein (DUF1800 family)